MRMIAPILLAAALAAQCGEAQSPTDPTPVAPATPVAPTPAPVPPPVAVAEPWCPGDPIRFEVSVSPGGLQFTFEPRLGPKGEFLRRYQVHLIRWSGENEWRGAGYLELEVGALSGPHNRRAVVTKPLPQPGIYKAAMRSWMPNECHDDGHGNQRLNGEWTPYTNESFSF